MPESPFNKRSLLSYVRRLPKRILVSVRARTGYSNVQWARFIMYRKLTERILSLGLEVSVLEISPGSDLPWAKIDFREYTSASFPDFDICTSTIGRKFDLIIADQVFEHLLEPYKAAKNVYDMLHHSGMFVTTTPFLFKVHDCPVDCTRWTELGLKYFLAEAGFSLERIVHMDSWGNLACVEANLRVRRGGTWPRIGWGRRLQNEPDFPVVVWAMAVKE